MSKFVGYALSENKTKTTNHPLIPVISSPQFLITFSVKKGTSRMLHHKKVEAPRSEDTSTSITHQAEVAIISGRRPAAPDFGFPDEELGEPPFLKPSLGVPALCEPGPERPGPDPAPEFIYFWAGDGMAGRESVVTFQSAD
jgi:hypothetical protein